MNPSDKHAHTEAFCLMQYGFGGQHPPSEVIWNSRDGEVPHTVPNCDGIGDLIHLPALDSYAPNHVPSVGDRIVVDMTAVRARQLAEDRVSRWELRDLEGRAPTGFPRLQSLFSTRQDCIQALFEATFDPALPDIVVVTAGYVERLLAIRQGLVEPEPRAASRARPRRPWKSNPVIDALAARRLLQIAGLDGPPRNFRDATLPDLIHAMEWFEQDCEHTTIAHTVISVSFYVETLRVVDNACGAVPRVYFQTALVDSRDMSSEVNVLDERSTHNATEEAALIGHAQMAERARNKLARTGPRGT
jgi:hypothetical protein